MPQRGKQKTGYDVDVLKKAEEAVDTGHLLQYPAPLWRGLQTAQVVLLN